MIKLLFLLLISLNAMASDWEDYIDPAAFPDSQHLQLPWRDSSDFVIERSITPEAAREVKLSCHSDTLYPTHPYQTGKEYIKAVFAHYEHYKLPVSSYACLRANPSNRFCVMGAIALAVVMSDTFEDSCGNLYRGYWLVTYFKSDENMGTLFSKGRTAYTRPGSPYEWDMIEGNTYEVKASDFLFLGKLLPRDPEVISQEQRRALKEGYRRQDKLFFRIN